MLTGGERWPTAHAWPSLRAWPTGRRLSGSWRPGCRSAVSQHLKILKDAGLVEDVAAGTRRIYRLNPVALAALRDQLDTYWQRALAGYADAVEAPTEEA
jgi:hypothetical protein